MGISTSKKRLSGERKSGSSESKLKLFLKRSKRWNFTRGERIEENRTCSVTVLPENAPIPYGDPELEEVFQTKDGITYIRRNTPEDDYCQLYTRTDLLRDLVTFKITSNRAPEQLDNLFDIVQKLRSSGMDINDKFLAHLILAASPPCYNWIIKEMDNLKIKLTSETVKDFIVKHAERNITYLYRRH